jgi:hemerythrin-like domain-containing protein
LKRAPELTDLSRDHHLALVLARRCERAAADSGDDAQLTEAWEDVKAAFSVELEPHFCVEEQLLLPSLTSAGETALVERTQREHARLRDLVRLEAEREVLREFGTLLRAHVRFEEQALFPCAERVSSPENLAAVATASAALETAKQRSRSRSESDHDDRAGEVS